MAVEARLSVKVQHRAKDRCEYCRMHQSLQGATFHVEHVIPRSKGGTSELKNLAWACPSCNLHKSDRVSMLNETGIDVRLFNPRVDKWNEHFEWEDFSMRGLSSMGKAMVKSFQLNTERKFKIRQAEKMFDIFPPDE